MIFFLLELIHHLYCDEDRKRNNDEIYDGLDEYSIGDLRFADSYRIASKINSTHERADERGDDVIHERRNNLLKCRTDDDTYRQINDIAPHGKLLKFLGKTFYWMHNFVFIVTCFIAWFFVDVMKLTGFGSDASVYLNFSTNGTLDFAGLLLASIIIGILGVLDDVSITQASVVQELKHANEKLNARELYLRAIKVGKDHIGSLVNTLALAYIGVSLPLVLLYATADASVALSLNQEVVAAELVRIIVGSIGLVLAIPITTVIAAWWFSKHDVDKGDVESHGHSHVH